MTERRRAQVLLFVFASTMGVGSQAQGDTGSATGVKGAETVSPAAPGPQRLGASGTAPFAGKEIHLFDPTGALAGSALTAPDGRFEIRVAPGAYSLRVATKGAFPRCPPASVAVREGILSTVEIRCDSGMR